MRTSIRQLLCVAVLSGTFTATLPWSLAVLHAATCVGATPCRACKNCSSCKHCAKDGGTCGVCRRTGSTTH